MTGLSSHLAAIFADPFLGLDAVWHPARGGDEKSVRVILRQPDMLTAGHGFSVVSAAVRIEVLADQISQPSDGDEVRLLSTTYRLVGAPQKSDCGSVWTCPASRKD